MAIHEDNIPIFIPKANTRFIIFGTMGAINARTINGQKPKEVFYYNNNRNHFWKVIQHLLQPEVEPLKFTIKEKKEFLNSNGIAMINLVKKVILDDEFSQDPSDTLLFEAHKKNQLSFKKISNKTKSIIRNKPIFFTCRHKKGIEEIVNGFFTSNNIDLKVKNNIWYWPTPTRCNPKKRGLLWKQEMEKHLAFINFDQTQLLSNLKLD